MSASPTFGSLHHRSYFLPVLFLVFITIFVWKCPSVGNSQAVVSSPSSSTNCISTWRELTGVRDASLELRRLALQNEEEFVKNKTLYDPFEMSWSCPLEQRIGRPFGDGGKFICGPNNFFTSRKCLVYSIGSNGDFSFEESIRDNFDCEIHTFDPTGPSSDFNALAVKHGVTFHPWGLTRNGTQVFENKVTGESNPLFTLPEVMARLDHKERHIDVLKVDCEGCEYYAFETIWSAIRKGELSVGQVIVEIHGVGAKHIRNFFSNANLAKFYIFHKERNQWGCEGYACVEFSLIGNQTAWDIHKHLRSDC